ncbi:hypothetical protein BDZ91DRAFT_644498, partial [Kalaharituber pfeilii]
NQCNAQASSDLCLRNANRKFEQCSGTDYQCKCDTARIALDCYRFCADDEGKGIQEGIVVAWCA